MRVNPKEINRSARVRARRSAVQALYQWLLTGQPMSGIIAEFERERKQIKKADGEYFRTLLSGISVNAEQLRETLGSFLDRKPDELDPVTRAVLHLGMYELMYQPQVPLRVVLNEAIELARTFGAEDSYKYINGVLDRAARQLRREEILSTD